MSRIVLQSVDKALLKSSVLFSVTIKVKLCQTTVSVSSYPKSQTVLLLFGLRSSSFLFDAVHVLTVCTFFPCYLFMSILKENIQLKILLCNIINFSPPFYLWTVGPSQPLTHKSEKLDTIRHTADNSLQI